MENKFRTHYCKEINEKNIDNEVIISGWVNNIRNLGKIIFLEIRDISGKIQVIVNNEIKNEIKKEYVLKISGVVKKKEKSNSDIEILANKIIIINKVNKKLPFFPCEGKEINELMALKYRYIYIRENEEAKKIIIRSKIINDIRKILNKENFLEIETPILTKSTPEGSRDYIVPSRICKKNFFALPQSPQIFKQILMISGIEKYYQIAKCFRDEDLRSDRQPEFTQLDIECSFTDEKYIMNLIEYIICFLFKKYLGINLKKPFKKISYKKSIKNFASDKPDLRNPLKIKFLNKKIGIIKNKRLKYLIIKDKHNIINNEKIIEYKQFLKDSQIKKYIYIKINNDNEIISNIKKPIILKEKLNIKKNRFILIFLKYKNIENLSIIRNKIYEDINKIKNKYKILWVINHPMFEWNKIEKKWDANHHPFTSPIDENLINSKINLRKIYSKSYDLVINGIEIGGGSIRIHNYETQEKIFKIIEKEENLLKEFDFFIEAIKSGCPPMGGIALGLDRLIMMITNSKSIKDIIAFPKTYTTNCPLTNAPSKIDIKNLYELGLNYK